MDRLLVVKINPLPLFSKARVHSLFDINGVRDYWIALKMSRQIVISLDVRGGP
jgi:hypothetical protein